MKTMATRVEMNSPLTSRATQAGLNDILSDVKLPQTHVSPLSDASNKSSDSSSNTTLIFEQTIKVPAKSVSMFNPGVRPRLSPKPFSKEKPPDFLESRNFMNTRLHDLVPKSSVDGKPQIDDQPETTIASLSSNLKNEGEKESRRFDMTTQEAKTEDQNAKSEASPATTGTRRLKTFNWISGASSVDASKPTSHVEEWKSSIKPEISSKLPVVSRKPEVEQRKETFNPSPSSTIPLDAFGEPSEDSSSGSVQLRPKRRPVSAIFLDSINDVAQANPMTAEEKALPSSDKSWIRKPRPLSMDLTAKFESRFPFVQKKESTFEETKENIPLNKNAISTTILEEKPDLGIKDEGGTSISGTRSGILDIDKKLAELSSAVTITNMDSPSQDKDPHIKFGTKKSYKQPENTDVFEDQGLTKLSKNIFNQTTKQIVQEEKPIPEKKCNTTNETQNANERVIAPGSIRRRISLLFANTGSSAEVTEPPTADEIKGSANIHQRIKGFATENMDIMTGRPRTSSQSRPLSSDLTKIFSSSPPNLEPRLPEKMKEVQSVNVFQETEIPKEKVDQKSNELSDETWKSRPFNKTDQPLQSEEDERVSEERKSYTSRNEQYYTATSADEKGKHKGPEETEFKTVRATVFEHNVQWHSAAKIYSSRDQSSNQEPKNEKSFDHFVTKKETEDWTDHMDNVKLVKQQSPDFNLSDVKNEEQLGKPKPVRRNRNPQVNVQVTDMQAPRNIKNVEDNLINQRIEPRYEIFQAVREKVSSESIKVVQEDKAVTLQSRRSFNKKDRGEGKPVTDADFSDRPWTKLHRSKSDYRKRDFLDGAKDTSSYRDLDAQRLKKYDLKAEISPPRIEQGGSGYKSEQTHPTDKNKTVSENTLITDCQVKAHRIDTNPTREENTIVSGFQERNYVQSGNNLKSKMYETSKSYSEFVTESIYKKNELVSSNFNAGEETKWSTGPSFRGQIYQTNRTQTEKDPEPIQKLTSKDEPTDVFKLMLNEEIEQMKKDLHTHPSAKDVNNFQTDIKKKEALTEEKDWIRGRDFLHIKDRDRELNDIVRKKSDDFKLVNNGTALKIREAGFRDESQQPVKFFNKDISPVDTKATYFAVTYIDNKKEKPEMNFLDQSTASNLISVDGQLKHDLQVHKTYATIHDENLPKESSVEKEDLERSSALKQHKMSKSHNLLEDDITTKTDGRTSRPFRRNVVDVDSLLQRSKQKPTINDESSSYLEPYVKPPVMAYERDVGNVYGGNVNAFDEEPRGIYKSKAIDIDSLMEDYKLTQQKSKDNKFVADIDYQGESRWERSRSLRSYGEKGSNSKWKDPTVKHFTSGEDQQHESPTWHASREITFDQEIKGDHRKPSLPKAVNQTDYIDTAAKENYQKKADNKREDQDFHMRKEKQSTTTTLESLLISSRRVHVQRKTDDFLQQDSLELPAELTSPYTYSKTSPFTEVKSDYEKRKSDYIQESFIGQGANLSVSLQNESKFSSTELKQFHPERRRPAKTSDLVTLMLEDKERRREQTKARQRISEENADQHRTPRAPFQQEWKPSDNKGSSESEATRRSSTRLQNIETVSEPFQRSRRNQHRDRVAEPKQDQLKQCFTRNSQSNRDTDTLVQEERQYGTWNLEQQSEDSSVRDSPSYDNIFNKKQPPHSRLSSLSQTESDQHDSITDPKDASLDRSSMDLDSTDGRESSLSFHEAKTDFSFIDQTTVLDSTALKNRVQLNRRSQRRAPSQTQRKSRLLMSNSQLEVIKDTDSPWMYTDTTEEKPENKEDSDEDEKPQRSSVPLPRMPMFPGMDPSALMTQLRKRQDHESSSESPTQLSRSPKSPLPQGTMGVKLLPTSADKQERGAESSPQWLKELKSKKRQSQYENPS